MASSKSGSAERRRGSAARAGSGKAPELFTLGGVRLVRQNVDETSKLGPKHLALLVYLFHEARPMHPSEVTDLLGRGREQEKEMEGLTRAVTWLRENVPGLDIRLTGETVEALGGVTLDTRQVDAAIDGGDPGHVEELYAGEFLEGFESGAPAFDEWAQKERGRLKRAWNHAMLSAAREAERRRKWELAADWWAVLVARAPMRAEAVAGLLGALADSRQGEEAARAYAEYEKRLKESGIAQPADPVREVISKHKLLQDVVAGRIKAPPEPPGAAKPAPRTEPASAAEPLESEQLVPDLDIEPTPAPPKPPPSKPAPSAPPAPPKPPPSTPAPSAAEVDKSPAPKEAWDEIVDIASAEEFEIDITPAPKVTPPLMPRPPGVGGASKGSGAEAAPPKPKPTPTPPPRRPKLQDDEALRQARQAAKEFRDIEYGIVHHEVTSVRRPWGPTLQKWWDELAPVRAKAAELGVAALQVAAAALVLGLQLAGRGLRVLGLKAGASLTAMGGRVRARRQWAAEARARRAELKREQGAQRAVDRGAQKEAKQAGREAQKEAKQAEKDAKKEARRADKQAKREAKRAQKETAQGVLEAPPEPELVEAPPWDEEPEVAPWDEEPLDTPSVRRPGFGRQVEFEPPAEEYAAPMEEAGASLDFVAPTGEVPLVEVTPARPRRRRRPVGPLLRRFRYVPVVLALAGLAVVFGPKLVGMIRGLTEDLPSQLPDVQAPSLPRVTLPRVTIRTPAFVETGVSRIAEMLSGSLFDEPGQWLLLADVEIVGADGEGAAATADGATTATLGLALEADLIQARFYNVVPHERALLARRTTTGSRSEALPLAEALSLVGSAGFTAVLGGRVSRYESVDSVVLQVFNPAGDTLYGVAAEVSEESSTLETLAGLARTVRRRLGEPRDEIAASLPARQVLSTSASALDAFAQARLHYYAGRYSQAITAARRAVARDSTFSLAYRLLAEAYAQSGQRTSARSALEIAWRFSERLTQRERLRLLADRHAWDGRLSDAILTYDDLFHDYRDDVGALKSQALLQRMIGVRGGGEGNLRVAYTIDPYDWPPLSRIARYLGYRGALPDVDSLIAAVREQSQ